VVQRRCAACHGDKGTQCDREHEFHKRSPVELILSIGCDWGLPSRPDRIASAYRVVTSSSGRNQQLEQSSTHRQLSGQGSARPKSPDGQPLVVRLRPVLTPSGTHVPPLLFEETSSESAEQPKVRHCSLAAPIMAAPTPLPRQQINSTLNPISLIVRIGTKACPCGGPVAPDPTMCLCVCIHLDFAGIYLPNTKLTSRKPHDLRGQSFRRGCIELRFFDPNLRPGGSADAASRTFPLRSRNSISKFAFSCAPSSLIVPVAVVRVCQKGSSRLPGRRSFR